MGDGEGKGWREDEWERGMEKAGRRDGDEEKDEEDGAGSLASPPRQHCGTQ